MKAFDKTRSTGRFPQATARILESMRGNVMIYLNNAATTYPKPASVLAAITANLGRQPHCSGRSAKGDGRDIDEIEQARRSIASLIGASDSKDVIFTSGATESLNLLVQGLEAIKGGHVITTAAEHNSMLRPLWRLEDEGLIALSVAGMETGGIASLDEIQSLARPDTTLLAVNHVSNVTGESHDIDSFGALAHKRGWIFAVDASQSVGGYAIDVKSSHIDALAFSGHKYLYGATGCGALYLSPRVEPRPLMTGGTGVRSDLRGQPPTRPHLYEAGTPNIPGIVSIGAGIEFIKSVGIPEITRKHRRLSTHAREKLSHIDGVTCQGGQHSSIISFTFAGVPSSEFAYILENSFDITTRSGLHCAPLMHKALGTWPEGTVRASPSHLTTDDDVAQFLEAVASICRSKR